MLTVAKFWVNNAEGSNNSMATKTLGKYGFLDNDFLETNTNPLPKDGEFWKVEIVKELVRFQADGNVGGCFLLRPIEPVGVRTIRGTVRPNVDYLIPGAYEVLRFGSALILHPSNLNFNWIFRVDDRRRLFAQHTAEVEGTSGFHYRLSSLVVSIDGSTSWPIHDISKPNDRQSIYHKRGETS